VSGLASPGSRVTVAIGLSGSLAEARPSPVGSASGPERISNPAAGALSGMMHGERCVPLGGARVDPIIAAFGTQSKSLLMFDANADSQGAFAWHGLDLQLKHNWYRPDAGRNLAILPGVSVRNALPDDCAVGLGVMKGTWNAASDVTAISYDVNGFVPPDAEITTSPTIDNAHDHILWAASNTREAASLGSPLDIAPSYTIRTGAMEQRYSAFLFLSGILAGGAVAGAMDGIRETFTEQRFTALERREGTTTASQAPDSRRSPRAAPSRRSARQSLVGGAPAISVLASRRRRRRVDGGE